MKVPVDSNYNYLAKLESIVENEVRKYIVSFFDFPTCFSEALERESAIQEAVKALQINIIELLLNAKDIPKPTKLEELETIKDKNIEVLSLDVTDYVHAINSNQAVKKTLTVPSWLNVICDRTNMNYSKILQQALIEKLLEMDDSILSETEKLIIRARSFSLG